MMTEHGLTREISRRRFNQASLTALFVGMTVWVGACGKSGGSDYSAPPAAPTPIGANPTPPASPSDKTGNVSDNHGHAAAVTGAQLQAGGGAILSIRGSADHDHAVELTAAQVAQIAAGTRVTKSSEVSLGGSDGYGGYSSPNHSHAVTFN